jgi:hypothetical protein
MLRNILILIFISIPTFVFAQIGGKRSFEFLNIPSNPKMAALGGRNITSSHGDPNMFLANPALLESGMHNHFSANYLNYFADIGFSSVTYSYNINPQTTLGAGLIYMGYGNFDGYDDSGNESGNFQANEFAIVTGGSHKLGNFSLGANMKLAGSNIASFRASALLFDMGMVFVHPDHDLKIGMAFQNLGFYLSRYETLTKARLPFEMQLGISFKPEHAPVRLSITAFNLTRTDGTYFDPGSRFTLIEEPGRFDRIFRHVNIGAEFLLSKNVNLRAGYNHLLRKELKLEQHGGLAGFSLGMMFRVKAFEFAYSNQIYHVAGGAHYFGVTSNLNSFFKKSE